MCKMGDIGFDFLCVSSMMGEGMILVCMESERKREERRKRGER